MADLIPFPRRPRPEAEPPPSIEELRAADRRRMLENLAAALFVVAFLALSLWVIDRVSDYSKALDCMQYRYSKACK